MFQNHMLQLLTLVAMEPPAGFDAEPYRDEKLKLLRTIRPFSADPAELDQWIVRAQYGTGSLQGETVPGYREEPGIPAESRTETYVALKVMNDSWRWAGVPFYLRSGKRLARRLSEIAVTFKHVPHSVFGRLGIANLATNVLVLNVQPEEGITLTIEAKRPGPKLCLASLTLGLDYRAVFGEDPPLASRVDNWLNPDDNSFHDSGAWSVRERIIVRSREGVVPGRSRRCSPVECGNTP